MIRGGEKDVKKKTGELSQKRWRACPQQSQALGRWGGEQKNLGNAETSLESSLLHLLLFLHFPQKFQETLHGGREVQEWGNSLSTSPPEYTAFPTGCRNVGTFSLQTSSGYRYHEEKKLFKQGSFQRHRVFGET